MSNKEEPDIIDIQLNTSNQEDISSGNSFEQFQEMSKNIGTRTRNA